MTGFWSTETLRERLPAEHLITPFDVELIENCSYELRLGPEVYVTAEGLGTKRTLKMGEQVRIPPGQFANLLTEEIVRIPADALGLISAKFRWKQRGLVNVSGFHVDPGYAGKLLFSVYNAGPTPVVVARGDPLFLLWYCSLDQETANIYRRPPRMGITSEDVSHLQGDVATPQALATRVQELERLVGIAKWLIGAIIAAIIAALIGIAIQAVDFGRDDSSDPSSTTSVPAPQVTSVPVTTQAVVPLPSQAP